MAGKFELKKSKNDKFYFSLLASNGQVILSSEMYEAKASAVNGIESVKKNGGDAARYDKLSAKDGSPYFTLKAGNGQVIGQTTTNEVGVFTAQLQLPANLGPGTYTIIGTCGTTTMSSSLTIRAATTTTARVTTGGGSLPQTGSDTTVTLVRGALVLLCLGGLVLVASKRRHGANVDS